MYKSLQLLGALFNIHFHPCHASSVNQSTQPPTSFCPHVTLTTTAMSDLTPDRPKARKALRTVSYPSPSLLLLTQPARKGHSGTSRRVLLTTQDIPPYTTNENRRNFSVRQTLPPANRVRAARGHHRAGSVPVYLVVGAGRPSPRGGGDDHGK